jgi:sugar lactone lactonase YvrE
MPEQPFPGHDGGAFAPVSHEVVARWPAGAFAENLAVAADGAVYVSLHSHNRIERYEPASGGLTTFAETPAPVAGLAFGDAGVLWATGGAVGQPPGHVWRIDPDGALETWIDVPDAIFLNGCALLGDGRTLLVCESATGRVLAVDMIRRAWRPWISDDRLRPSDPQMPGANGLKVARGFAYVSVTDANHIYRCRLQPDGSAGPLELVAENLRADDFAVSQNGALFIATHPAQTVVRLAPDGGRTTVAGPEQGVVGSTACAFGRTSADRTALYVTTNGGLYRPHNGVLEDAKLVRLEVDEAALSPTRA